ncbi:uncharacterized protein BO97DRAFT_412162 [Aspergillus homomorphus CBS 101889]|uniref:Uncharacterized protein n=1 Tax=Aspergillus homomorphus (strain CBS 101889) TaxID=1450537 RepID=A0A395I3T0_ASPHC|nr:hypothetical protein BO97DRAFT_412162 [Aspergillus homomorphus CBS 101889]RAL14861.1 hypothetical protein BO97DRAFT_412162 [Aspergillus homomorphus CBS 101889]
MAFIGTASEISEELLKDDDAKRLVIKINAKRLQHHDYRGSACAFFRETFPDWEDDSRINFLHIEVRGGRVFLVIDINHLEYDFKTAHTIDDTSLPVYVLSSHYKLWALVRWPQYDDYATIQMAHLHMLNGYDAVTPFFVDNSKHMLYSNPRNYYGPIYVYASLN